MPYPYHFFYEFALGVLKLSVKFDILIISYMEKIADQCAHMRAKPIGSG